MIGPLMLLSLASGATAPAESRWLTLGNGVTLRYEERGDPSAAAVVLLHGLTDSRQSYERLTALLPPRIRTIAIDLRGHGDSDRPGEYGIADMAGDVVRFLDAKGERRVTLVGHSMGSLVAREAARRGRDRVTRLVLIGSGVSFDNPAVRAFAEELRARGNDLDAAFVEGFQRSTLHAPVPQRFFDGVMAASCSVPPVVWRRAVDGILAYDDARALEAIRVPTLLIWGAHDGITSRADQDRLLSGIAGSYLVVYPDVGHAPHWERPAVVVADLLAFLDGESERR
jgi:pimeloyl-ACP methyl ester carboxylesterase